MTPEEYREQVTFNLQDNDYERVETDTDQFSDVYTATKTLSSMDSGRERRFIGTTIVDGDLSIGEVRDGVDELKSIGEENVRVNDITIGKGGLATMPLFPLFVTDGEVDPEVKSSVKDMKSGKGVNLRVPVLAEVSDGGRIRGGGVSLTYPVPKRRHLAKRRAVKKFVAAVFDE